MAISYIVSYSFSPSTTIASSQVNTNFSDNANTWVGLEAKTKTFSNLGVDTELKSGGTIKSADGTVTAPGFTFTSNTALGLYLSGSTLGLVGLNAWSYRRPVLQWGSVTTVAVESGLDGTSGDIPLLFPDGTLRTETSTTRTTFNITRNAVLVTSGAQSGLTGATSEATNTWYALYGVKVTDSSTLWVTVGSTVLPLQANYATLNTAYGTNGWVYLGLIRNGDNSSATGDILDFSQCGNSTLFRNSAADANTFSQRGTLLANTASATSLTYTYAGGTGTTNIPNNVTQAYFTSSANTTVGDILTILNSGGTQVYAQITTAGQKVTTVINGDASKGILLTLANARPMAIFLYGFVDGSLGIGTNPLL